MQTTCFENHLRTLPACQPQDVLGPCNAPPCHMPSAPSAAWTEFAACSATACASKAEPGRWAFCFVLKFSWKQSWATKNQQGYIRNIQKRTCTPVKYQDASKRKEEKKNLLSTVHKNMTKLPKTKIFSFYIPSSNYFEAHKIQHLGILTENKKHKQNTLFSILKQKV